jgi:ribosomal protein S12 methylthiotransferase accessory factor
MCPPIVYDVHAVSKTESAMALPRPQWKPSLRYTVVPPEGVILLAERRHILLRGETYMHLAPLLDGQYTAQAICEQLQGRVTAPEVFYALALLQRQGYVVDMPPPLPPEQAAFWELLDVDAAEAARRLRVTPISVVAFGAVDPAPLHALCTALGIQVSDAGERWVVLSEDYLHPELETFNRTAVACQRPWLLVKPLGAEVCIGPLFLPGHTGCWLCLAQRLRGARKVTSYLQETQGACDPFTVPPATLPSTYAMALQVTATEIAKWVVCGSSAALAGRLVTLDTLSLAQQQHLLVQRPECPCCGDPHMVAARQTSPLMLHARPKTFTMDGGHRSQTPTEALRKLAHHISPLTGIVTSLQLASEWVEEHGVAPTYVARHNFMHVSGEEPINFDFLVASMRGASAGKGKQSTQAKVSALGEAIERYSGVFQDNEARIWATAHELGAAAVLPNTCMLFSAQQFAQRHVWNQRRLPTAWVPEPFNPAKAIEWSPVWSLTTNARRYVPTAYCYYGYARRHHVEFARADSNGCAAGHHLEEAILQGFMELVERDSIALWWYNRLRKPAVDLSSFADPYIQALQAHYQAIHRALWVLDLTSDLQIPTFAAIARRTDQGVEELLLGFGAHFDPQIALLRALTEANQSLAVVEALHHDARAAALVDTSEALSWWQTATLANQPYLAPDDTTPLKKASDYPPSGSDDCYTDVLACVQLAAVHGFETLVLDQSRPDTDLHVVKVMVPGLRHFWPRFGPGRLYDVPVRMGWLPTPLREEQLNPQHIYF